jgi:hypothetical protein
MEEITRIVADSLARHGFSAPVDRRLEWSRWFRCESSFSLLLVPSEAGVYALAEEVVASGELPSTGGKRMLAVFQVCETEDLCVALSRLFAPRNPVSTRLSSGRCFVRFALVTDAQQRQAASESLNRWLSSSEETIMMREAPTVLQAPPGDYAPEKTSDSGTPENEPPPLPAGF